jgi:Putative zinc ribbon domain
MTSTTMPLCQSCGSCGFPMRNPEDHAGGDLDALYCSTCADDSGKLRPYDDVVQANAEYFVAEQGVDIQAASSMARALLASMPAWKDRL